MKRAMIVFWSAVWLVICAGSAGAAEKQSPLKVGVILPLSGSGAGFGHAVKNGATLALEKLEPKVRERIKLYYEDDQLQAKNTIAAFHKLRNEHDIDVVLTVSSGTSKPLSSVTEKKQIPHVAIATDKGIVAGRKWVVNFWVTPEEEARVACEEVVSRGYKRIARISTIQEAMLSLGRFFDDYCKGKVEVVLDEEYPPEVTDFRTYVAKFRREKNIDAVMALLMPGQLGVFARQAKAHGGEVPLFGIESFEEPNEVKISQGALIGQWYVNNDEPGDAFIEEYIKAYPGASPWGAANAHDAILLLGAAANKGMNREELRDYLHSVKNFTGALGTFSASGDNRFTLPATVKVVTKDGFKKGR